jgi:benzoyl-CoA reductase/2-hydroxyglutaryl-CoA dehydratase subunit BcrC/BadD/HgdB
MSGTTQQRTRHFRTFNTLKRRVWYEHVKARVLGRLGWKVAWVTSGAPVEILLAFDILPLYPENHSAICSARHMGERLKSVSVREGFNPDLCSYGHIDVGSLVTGQSPVGGLARPDILFCCNNICGTVLKWYQSLGRYFDAPLLFIDTPFLNDELGPDEPPPGHVVRYVQTQLEEIVRRLEKITGKRFDGKKFMRILINSAEAITLWLEILNMNRIRPAPMTCFDAFVHMAPIVTMRGTRAAVRYYEALLREMKERVRDGVAAVPGEKTRVVWDNIPVWYKMRDLSRHFKGRKICLVADTYTIAWGEHRLPETATLREIAELYTGIFLNRGMKSKARRMANLVRDFHADAFVVHSNRSCKPYSFGQYDIVRLVSKETGKPGIVIEADHADPAAFSDDQVFGKLDAFWDSVTGT